jgi:hypothetical protein
MTMGLFLIIMLTTMGLGGGGGGGLNKTQGKIFLIA